MRIFYLLCTLSSYRSSITIWSAGQMNPVVSAFVSSVGDSRARAKGNFKKIGNINHTPHAFDMLMSPVGEWQVAGGVNSGFRFQIADCRQYSLCRGSECSQYHHYQLSTQKTQQHDDQPITTNNNRNNDHEKTTTDRTIMTTYFDKLTTVSQAIQQPSSKQDNKEELFGIASYRISLVVSALPLKY